MKILEPVINTLGTMLVVGCIGTTYYAGASLERAKHKTEHNELQNIREILDKSDVDRSGTLSEQELNTLANEIAKLRKLQIK